MSRPGHREKDKYEHPNPRRTHTIMSPEDAASGKKTHWPEMEITGSVRCLSPALWKMTHLTCLYMNDNNLTRLPPDINRLQCLTHLDVSSNKLRTLPPELGDLIMLRELLLNNNYLRVLPYELGKLFRLQSLGLKHNPLTQEFLVIYNEPGGTYKLLSYLLDNVPCEYNFCYHLLSLAIWKARDICVRHINTQHIERFSSVLRLDVDIRVKDIREVVFHPLKSASRICPPSRNDGQLDV